jgi:integrase
MIAVRRGIDPLALPPSTDMTFGELADCYITEHKRRARPNWTHEVERMLQANVLPYLGALQAENVTRIDVARVVERVAGRGAFESADHVLGLIRAIYNWGAGTGRTDHDPTKGLKKRNLGRPRERVLTDDEIRLLWGALDQLPITDRTISPGIRDALKLQLVLGVRIGEAMGARKCEIDLAAGIWVIPATRTKSKREHKLPLSSLASKILRDAMVRAGSSAWLFPSDMNSEPIRPKSASRALLRLRGRVGIEDVGTHDLRRTMATRLGDMGVSDEMIGRVLNHAPATVTRRHYNHARRLAEMRAAIEAWAHELLRIVRGLSVG